MKAFVLPSETYTNSDYNRLRRGYILLLAELLESHIDAINNAQPDAAPITIQQYVNDIIAMELSCYQHAIEIATYELFTPSFSNIQFEHLYRTKITRITKNIDAESEVADNYLATQIIAKKIDVSNISRLSPEELAPSKNNKILEELNARRNQTRSVKVSTDYTCGKCHKRETTIRSSQMRSLDEGETLTITCMFCSYKWFI